MATPLRFRRSNERWTIDRVREDLLASLDANIGAQMRRPWYREPAGYEARRFEMDNGDLALFLWRDDVAYWLGNTETPSALWRTDKYTFDQVPDEVAAWAERELLAQLHEESPWLAAYPTISWFFLPVLLSKDGRETSRQFLREYAAGFPDADWEDGLQFYESFLDRGILEEYRYVMASKLGTTESFDLDRMRSAMSEFTVARLLDDAGYDVEPDVEVTTGHFIDFRVDRGGPAFLVEVTRPRPPDRRSAGTVGKAISETVDTKTTGQLAAHGGGITLFVDCSSFSADQWATVRRDHPSVAHRPAVVFRAHTDGHFEGYTLGSVPIDLPETFERV